MKITHIIPKIKDIKFFLKKNIHYIFIFIVIIVFTISVLQLSKPPKDFPKKLDIVVKQGQSISEVGDELFKNKIIKSPFLFKLSIMVLGPKGKILSGEYRFNQPQNLFSIASRLSEGRFGFDKVKIVIFEGMTVSDMAIAILRYIPNFNASAFVALASPYEGYLMPDTYIFYENVGPKEVMKKMRDNFKEKTKSLFDTYDLSDVGIKKVVIISSLIEKEVSDYQDKRIVAGIINNRLSKNMPLQLDASLWYVYNKSSRELTLNDLKSNSPYNLYKYKGLTPTPISNPGLETMQAVLNPLPTKYFYFLTDKDNKVHYAETLDEHNRNKSKYID